MPQDPVIQKARIQSADDAFHVAAAPKDHTAVELARMDLEEEEEEQEEMLYFETIIHFDYLESTPIVQTVQ